jgi:rfaE bifunctional protein kinase chain/domain
MRAKRIAVVGDVFLDEYLVGKAERLSREGPVPVLAFLRRFCVPGGAANPAINIAALGAVALQIGVVGEDASAGELRVLLEEAGIDPVWLVVDRERDTVLKTRVVAEGLSAPQQVARIDRQDRRPIGGATEALVVGAIEKAATQSRALDAILVSHYCSGVVTESVARAALAQAREQGIWSSVDAQGDLERFEGFDLVRVGRNDAARSLGDALESEESYARVSRELRERLGARVVMLGRGAEGMSVAHEDGYAVVPPANVSEVFDVTGAGDTVIAVMTLALASGAAVLEAVSLANAAAALVVRRLGVAAPEPDELIESWLGGSV